MENEQESNAKLYTGIPGRSGQAGGLTAAEAATRLNMNQGTLTYWVTQARKGIKSAVSVAGVPSAAELVAENKQLRKALAEARMESEILKNRPSGLAPSL